MIFESFILLVLVDHVPPKGYFFLRAYYPIHPQVFNFCHKNSPTHRFDEDFNIPYIVLIYLNHGDVVNLCD